LTANGKVLEILTFLTTMGAGHSLQKEQWQQVHLLVKHKQPSIIPSFSTISANGQAARLFVKIFNSSCITLTQTTP